MLQIMAAVFGIGKSSIFDYSLFISDGYYALFCSPSRCTKNRIQARHQYQQRGAYEDAHRNRKKIYHTLFIGHHR